MKLGFGINNSVCHPLLIAHLVLLRSGLIYVQILPLCVHWLAVNPPMTLNLSMYSCKQVIGGAYCVCTSLLFVSAAPLSLLV